MILIFSSLPLWSAPEIEAEITDVERAKAAKAFLSSEENVVTLYAKDLTCETCAISIRKKLTTLRFVDRKRFNKGVDLDAKTQLVLIALRSGKSANPESLSKAVKDAGYKPVRLYEWEKDALKTTSLK